ncbi:unnamed protein product [Lymnaea stagnalis]|uniref:EGF-like domain-containing protein n=1 Tax=Lymnaea stagnalis TaxID=6523 RepID=A0AAV2IF72_LYMST
MDYLHVLWLMMPILAWMLASMADSAAEMLKKDKSNSSSMILQSLSSPTSRPSSTQRSYVRSGDKNDCCDNGGICVMGVFCHCPDKFYGFRCEFERRPCGVVAHAQWVRMGCNLCRCFDAELYCLPRVYGGCDDKPIKEHIDISDYPDDMEIFPNDETTSSSPFNQQNAYDDYDDDSFYTYDNSDDSKRNGKHGSSGSHTHSSSTRTWLTWTLVSILFTKLLNMLLRISSPS